MKRLDSGYRIKLAVWATLLGGSVSACGPGHVDSTGSTASSTPLPSPVVDSSWALNACNSILAEHNSVPSGDPAPQSPEYLLAAFQTTAGVVDEWQASQDRASNLLTNQHLPANVLVATCYFGGDSWDGGIGLTRLKQGDAYRELYFVPQTGEQAEGAVGFPDELPVVRPSASAAGNTP